MHRETERDSRLFQIAAVSSICGFLVQAMTDYSFYNYRVMFLFWAILGLGALLAGRTALPEREVAKLITILDLISDTNIGGAGRVILNYLHYTDLEHFRTLVAVPRGSALASPLKKAGAEVYEVDAMADRSYDKEDVKVLTEFIRRVKPDLVHTHGCLSGRIAAKKCGLPVVYSRHSAFPVPAKLKYPPGRWVNRWVNRHYADKIIAVSPATMDNLVESGVAPNQITVVMNGVAPLTATSPEEQAALKKELGIGPDTVVFGILARIEEYKGHGLDRPGRPAAERPGDWTSRCWWRAPDSGRVSWTSWCGGWTWMT